MTTGRDLTPEQAEDAARALEMLDGVGSLTQAAEAFLEAHGKPRPAPGPDALTVGDLYGRFRRRLQKRREGDRTIETARRKLRGFIRQYGDRPAESVTPAEVGAWLGDIHGGVIVVDGYRRYLRRLFAHGVRIGEVSENPVREVQGPVSCVYVCTECVHFIVHKDPV